MSSSKPIRPDGPADPKAVARGVADMVDRRLEPAWIRDRVLGKIEVHRKRLVDFVVGLGQAEGLRLDPAAVHRQIFSQAIYRLRPFHTVLACEGSAHDTSRRRSVSTRAKPRRGTLLGDGLLATAVPPATARTLAPVRQLQRREALALLRGRPGCVALRRGSSFTLTPATTTASTTCGMASTLPSLLPGCCWLSSDAMNVSSTWVRMWGSSPCWRRSWWGLAARCSPSKRPPTFERLAAMRSPHRNVSLQNCAVADRDGELEFSLGPSDHSGLGSL